MDKNQTNKWTVHLARLDTHIGISGNLTPDALYVVDAIEVNGVPIRCTGITLSMSPKSPVRLHLDVMPRDLEIVMESEHASEQPLPVEDAGDHLMIARYVGVGWVIDEDSEYILDRAAGDQAVCLTVSKIEPMGGGN